MKSKRSAVLREALIRARAILMVLRADSRHTIECQLVRFGLPRFREHIEKRIITLEGLPHRGIFQRDTLAKAYELMARYHENCGEYAAAKAIIRVHAQHPMLPADGREDVYVWAGLRALRQRRYDDAREFLELAKANHSGERKPPFFAVLQHALDS